MMLFSIPAKTLSHTRTHIGDNLREGSSADLPDKACYMLNFDPVK